VAQIKSGESQLKKRKKIKGKEKKKQETKPYI